MTVRLNGPMSKRKHLLSIAVAVTAVVTLAACGDDEGSGTSGTAREAAAASDGAPPKLAALQEEQNELLPGGIEAFDARLRELEGHPVVVTSGRRGAGRVGPSSPTSSPRRQKGATRSPSSG